MFAYYFTIAEPESKIHTLKTKEKEKKKMKVDWLEVAKKIIFIFSVCFYLLGWTLALGMKNAWWMLLWIPCIAGMFVLYMWEEKGNKK